MQTADELHSGSFYDKKLLYPKLGADAQSLQYASNSKHIISYAILQQGLGSLLRRLGRNNGIMRLFVHKD